MKMGLGLSLRRRGPSGPSYGPELVTNGDGSTIVGWTSEPDSILSSVGGRLRVTIDADGVASGAGADQTITLEVGQTYRFQVTMWASEITKARATAVGSGMPSQYIAALGPDVIDVNFIASGNFILNLNPASAAAWGAANAFAEFDNISLKKVL